MTLLEFLILRKPRSGCLEGRTALIQLIVNFLTPANAGVQSLRWLEQGATAPVLDPWIPAFAGMTVNLLRFRHSFRARLLDTDVVLSGLNSPAGASRLLLIAAWEGAIVPLASVAMMLEYEAVLKRPEHLLRMRLQSNDIDRFVDNWAALVEPVIPYFS